MDTFRKMASRFNSKLKGLLLFSFKVRVFNARQDLGKGCQHTNILTIKQLRLRRP